MKKSIAIFTTHPIQYQAPLFKYLSQKKHIDLNIFFASDQGINKKKVDTGFTKKFAWNINLLNGYKYKFIGDNNVKVSSFFLRSKNIKRIISDSNFQVIIIFGWSSIFFLQVVFWSLFYRKSLILRSESSILEKNNLIKKILKKIILFNFFKIFRKILYIGKNNLDFYLKYGVPRSKLIYSPYSVDNDFFSHKDDRTINKLKKKYNCQNKIIYLFSGKFIQRKNPLFLLRVINQINLLRKKNNNFFIFIGDGLEKEKCIEYSKKNNINNVVFLGFVNQKQIVNYYSLADFLILPSKFETWGLVVNEAMAASTGCIVTSSVGCARDLVREGTNGFIYRSDDNKELVKIILGIKKKNVKFMKKSSFKIIKNYSIRFTSYGFLKAFKNI